MDEFLWPVVFSCNILKKKPGHGSGGDFALALPHLCSPTLPFIFLNLIGPHFWSMSSLLA